METLNRLCDSQRYRHHYQSPDYYIQTPVGKWRIDTSSLPIDVYHINLVVTAPEEDLYHKQHRLFLSLEDTFEYIRRHDNNLIAEEHKAGNDAAAASPDQ